jgi:nucleoside-diphosphate-sugar epimerase
MIQKKKVLLLGANGNIGKDFVDEYLKNYKQYYDLILGVHTKKTDKIKGLKVVKFELSNLKSLKVAMKGCDVVVNLAANPEPKAKFHDLVKPNLIGAYHVLEAAKLSKVSRVILASSVHAVRGYPLNYKVGPTDVPKPLNFYGATKVFAEALCNVYSTQYNLSCLAIRIGAYISNDQKDIVCPMRENYDYVISQRDMAQLIHKCIIASKKVRYGILAGISNNKKQSMELNYTRKLVGYKPKDDSYKMCKVVEKTVKKWGPHRRE